MSPLLYLPAFAIRLALFHIPAIAETLASRVEIVTPITSYKRLTEGLYLFESHVPPYDGGVFHQSPIFLALFQLLNFLPSITVPILYALTDITIAYLLTEITTKKQAIYGVKPKLEVEKGAKGIEPWVVGALYLFNPLSILSCVSKSTLIFTNASIVLAVYYALQGEKSLGMFWVAMASYLSFYPAMLVAPIILIILNWGANGSTILKKDIVLHCVLLYATWLAALLFLSYQLVGSWDFMGATYGVIDVRPVPALLFGRLPAACLHFRCALVHKAERAPDLRNFHVVRHHGHLQELPINRRRRSVSRLPSDSRRAPQMYASIHSPFPPTHTKREFSLSLLLRYRRHALRLPDGQSVSLRLDPRPHLLAPVDLRRERQRQLLLRHHARLQYWPDLAARRCHVRYAAEVV
ncbi:GPI transamidase subunit PIG-U-domain-containing protein [Jimgerdemannia flammicorona]|uniref:GPI transamidase subunit PIG-U-domain-containing protein n=1 Tax=Jimgerdemannia flammicorona TaxID=994334 RepID=A0A433QLE5_9FUNG|nr:GPI transamidase subunit PIG-U-domain-containing protein [Jimgerdemannia flammicorona]